MGRMGYSCHQDGRLNGRKSPDTGLGGGTKAAEMEVGGACGKEKRLQVGTQDLTLGTSRGKEGSRPPDERMGRCTRRIHEHFGYRGGEGGMDHVCPRQVGMGKSNRGVCNLQGVLVKG